MEKKHIDKRKPYDDEWSNLGKSLEGKIEPQEIMEIQDRAITFSKDKIYKTNEEDYKEKSEDFKDSFDNTAQYLKFINAHLSVKKNQLDKLLSDKEKFNDDLAILNPNKVTKEQLDKKNYNKLSSNDVLRALKFVEDERDSIQEKIEHFTKQMHIAKEELGQKIKQIDEIKTELSQLEVNNKSIQETETDKDPMGIIQKEIKSLATKNETEKIFGAINSLVVLLNSKNQTTLNELNTVKEEFKKMKREYDKVMFNLEEKKQKK